MTIMKMRAALAFLLTTTAGSSLATGPAIGLAVVRGSFTIDDAAVRGNSTVFDGSAVRTTAASSRIQLDGGQEMTLGAASSARVYRSRLVLEKGAGQIKGTGNYRMQAAGLDILPASDATARVQYTGESSVVVSAAGGPVQVTNGSGVLVARISPGVALSLTPQSGPAPTTKVAGCLLKKSGKLILMDKTTKVVFELEGGALEKEVGNSVEVVGMAVSRVSKIKGVSQVLQVAAAKQISLGGCTNVAAGAVGVAGAAGTAAGAGAGGSGAAGAGAAGAAAATGMSTAATVAIVGGVSAAATVGGLAAADVIGGEEESSTSR